MVDEGKRSLQAAIVQQPVATKEEPINPFVHMTEEEVEERNKVMIPAQYQLIEEVKSRPAIVTNTGTETEKKKDAEEKYYIILFVFADNEGDANWWQKVLGRKAAYERIKDNIDGCDIYSSFVLVEGIAIEKAVTVYEFMKYCQDNDFFEKDSSFDIEDYNVGYEESSDKTEDGPLPTLIEQTEDSTNERPKVVNPFTHIGMEEKDV